MLETLLPLIVLFFVIIDPLASFVVFLAACGPMKLKERRRTAVYAVLLAAALAFCVLLLGPSLLRLFSTTIDEFKVAGGIILGILGIKMARGQSITEEELEHDRTRALAAVIATPMLTGPAAITAIIISAAEHGIFLTGAAVAIVLAFTAFIFLMASDIRRYVSTTAILIMSTLLGLITLAWAVKYVVEGVLGIAAAGA